MNSTRIKTIRKQSTPYSYCDIQVLLEFANFYKRFIYQYSYIVASMTDLLKGIKCDKKSESFIQPDSVEQALRELKACFESVTVLQHYDSEKRTQIKTDTSEFAVIDMMSQLCKEHADDK